MSTIWSFVQRKYNSRLQITVKVILWYGDSDHSNYITSWCDHMLICRQWLLQLHVTSSAKVKVAVTEAQSMVLVHFALGLYVTGKRVRFRKQNNFLKRPDLWADIEQLDDFIMTGWSVALDAQNFDPRTLLTFTRQQYLQHNVTWYLTLKYTRKSRKSFTVQWRNRYHAMYSISITI